MDFAMTDELKALLVARAYLYKLFWLVFRREPDEETLRALESEATEGSLSVFLGSECRKSSDALQLSDVEVLRSCESRFGLDALRWEYTRLFIGPAEPIAPPWESVYLSKSRLIKQRATLEVREAYLDAGLLPAGGSRTLDDHLAIELDFLFRLADKMRINPFFPDVADNLNRSLSFLQNHLLKWLPMFVGQLEGSVLYSLAGRLLLEFAQEDEAFLLDLARSTG